MLDRFSNDNFDTTKPDGKLAGEADNSKLSFLSEMTTASANQAKTIYNGVAQVGEALHLGHLDKAILTEQSAAPTMSLRWWAQEAGSLAVSLPLILATHKGLGIASERALGQSAADFSVTRMAATGAIYEGIFKPSNLSAGGAGNDKDSLSYSRLKQAGEGALSFAAMQMMAKGGANSYSNMSSLFDKVVTGTAAGGAGGLVQVQSQSYFDRGQFASLPKSLDAAARGALLGTALSGLGALSSVEAVDVVRDRSVPSQDVWGKSFAGRDIVSENPSLKSGRDFASQGQHAEALPHLDKALEQLQRSYGPNSPEAAQAMSALARSNMFLGRNDAALDSANNALQIFEANYGERSPEAADAWDQIAAIHQRTGNTAQAAEALDKSLVAGRAALVDGKFSPSQKAEFETEQADRIQRLSNLYKVSGNKQRAAEVLLDIPKPKPKETYLKVEH